MKEIEDYIEEFEELSIMVQMAAKSILPILKSITLTNDKEILTRISKVAKHYQSVDVIQKEVDRLSKLYKEYLETLSQETIPSLMDQAEQEELLTSAGIKLKVERSFRAYINKENESAAHNFLEDVGYGSVAATKVTSSFSGKNKENLENFMNHLSKEGLDHTISRSINWRTLGTVTKELITNGVTIDPNLIKVVDVRNTNFKIIKED